MSVKKSFYHLNQVWSMVIGGLIGWIVPSQGTFQRFLAVPTRRDGQMYFFFQIYTANRT